MANKEFIRMKNIIKYIKSFFKKEPINSDKPFYITVDDKFCKNFFPNLKDRNKVLTHKWNKLTKEEYRALHNIICNNCNIRLTSIYLFSSEDILTCNEQQIKNLLE